jgi:hypothetical protein
MIIPKIKSLQVENVKLATYLREYDALFLRLTTASRTIYHVFARYSGEYK